MTIQLETRDRLTPGAPSSALAEWHYSPSLEATDHVKIQPRYNLFIGGEFVEPHSKRWFETINPATEETLSEVAEDRKSTRLNSSHANISYAVFCLKKKKKKKKKINKQKKYKRKKIK